jgi:hypothetical protein
VLPRITFIFNMVLMIIFFLLFLHVAHQAMEKFERILGVHRVEHLFAASLVDHEVARLERFEVLGYRRLGELHDARELVHRLSALEQGLDDPVPRRIPDALAELVYFLAEIRHI